MEPPIAEPPFLTLSRCVRAHVGLTCEPDETLEAYGHLSRVLERDEVTEWKSRPAPSVLALTGAARSGKSAILASIWSSLDTNLRAADSVFLFFSFERLGSKDVSALLLPRMLLWQLLTQCPECTNHLDTAVKDYGLSVFCSLPLLWSILGNAFGSLQRSQLFIALDGFDSCLVSLQETAVGGLASSFSKIQHNSITTLRLLIALRDPVGNATRSLTDGLHPSELQASSVLRVIGPCVSRALVAINPKWNLEGSEDWTPEEQNQLSIISSGLDTHARSDLLWPMLQLYMTGVILQDNEIPLSHYEFVSRLTPETVARTLNASSNFNISQICRAILLFYAKQHEDLPLLISTISLFGHIPHGLASDLCPTFDLSLLPFLNFTDSDISFVHHSFASYFAPLRNYEKRVFTRIGISSLYYLDSNIFDKNESQITSGAISEIDFFVSQRQEYHFMTRFLSTCVDGGVLTEDELAMASGLILLDSPRSRSWFHIVCSFIPLPLGSPCQSFETTELHTATICGLRDLILWYTQTFDASSTTPDKFGRIPLHYAAALGDKAAVELLRPDGSSITFPDKDGVTPLELASWPGNEEIAFMLLERLTARRFSGQPIFSLTESNTARIAFLIRLAHQRTNLPPSHGNGRFSLLRGIDLELVTLLPITQAQWLNESWPDGRDALQFSCFVGNEVMIDFLLHCGAGPDKVSTTWGTAVHIAVRKSDKDLLELLLPHSTPNIGDVNGQTALHCAVIGGWTECLRILLGRGWSSVAIDSEGNSPLQFAAARGDLEAVKILAQDSDLRALGVSAHELQANCDQGAIDIALDKGNIEIMVELIERGHVPTDGDRALKFACEQNHAALVSLIIESCVITGITYDNIAALEAAAWRKNTEVVEAMMPVTSEIVLETLLSKAAAAGQCQILTLILSSIPRTIDTRRMIRLIWPDCLRNGFVEAARSILQHWIKVNLEEGYPPGVDQMSDVLWRLNQVLRCRAYKCLKILLEEDWKALKPEEVHQVAASGLKSLLPHKETKWIQFFLDQGALKCDDLVGSSPLLYQAIATKSLPVVRLLVNSDASLDCSWNSLTPLEYSAQHGTTEITQYIWAKVRNTPIAGGATQPPQQAPDQLRIPVRPGQPPQARPPPQTRPTLPQTIPPTSQAAPPLTQTRSTPPQARPTPPQARPTPLRTTIFRPRMGPVPLPQTIPPTSQATPPLSQTRPTPPQAIPTPLPTRIFPRPMLDRVPEVPLLAPPVAPVLPRSASSNDSGNGTAAVQPTFTYNRIALQSTPSLSSNQPPQSLLGGVGSRPGAGDGPSNPRKMGLLRRVKSKFLGK